MSNSGGSDATVAVSYLPGFIVLSYVISSVGCATTLELLRRRTAVGGLYNWFLLLTSSITMGGIGIWCMHFIGNRAVVLGDGAANIQISYSVAWTGFSFALPVCVLFLGFYAAGVGEKATYGRILAGGLLTGSAVCAMHYVGQLGISNYKCSYRFTNILGSAIIALLASTTALGVFFRWRATWADVWWIRGICACFLAAAVSGMHWTATVGTSYRERDVPTRNGGQLSRSQTVIICAVLSCVPCIVLLIRAITSGEKRRRSTTRAHQLVLTCAFFDSEGQIMVTPEAFLPTRKIVERYIGRTFKDDDLTRTHPAFLWAFRASRNWGLVKNLVPLMRSRLESEQSAIRNHVLSRGVEDTELQTDFDTLFKQLFCVAAQELADELRQPLQDLGVLYDDILGTMVSTTTSTKSLRRPGIQYGRGQLIFTVRQLTKQEAARLATLGFRFASIQHVTSMLSRRIHVPSTNLGLHLKDMRDYATSSRNFEPGVHLISFIMRPTIYDHFEILTAKGSGNPLPSSTLPIKRLQMQHLDLISHMDGWPILTCLNWLASDEARSYHDAHDFRKQLIKAMSSLSTSLTLDINRATAFSARPLVAPCRASAEPAESNCFLLAFCAVGTLATQVSNPDLTFTPFRLFRAQQQTNDGIIHRDAFDADLFASPKCPKQARSNSLNTADADDDIYIEGQGDGDADWDTKSTHSTTRLARWPSLLRKHSTTRTTYPSSTHLRHLPHSQQPPTPAQDPPTTTTTSSPSPFGEIMVQKEVKVDVSKFVETGPPGATQNSTVVAAGGASGVTYVDELYSLCYAPGVRMQV